MLTMKRRVNSYDRFDLYQRKVEHEWVELSRYTPRKHLTDEQIRAEFAEFEANGELTIEDLL